MPVPGCCECGDEVSGSIKGEGFLDRMSDRWLLGKDFAVRGW
jgi:hypothetical protein